MGRRAADTPLSLLFRSLSRALLYVVCTDSFMKYNRKWSIGSQIEVSGVRRGKVNLLVSISTPPTFGPILGVTTPSAQFYPDLVVPIVKEIGTHICTQ